MNTPNISIRFLSSLCFCAVVVTTPLLAAEKLQYNRDIRPILAANCFACHGPDSAARKADLRLDQREDAIGMEAIVPGKPDDSELVQRLDIKDPKKRMPPASTHKTLTVAQKETLKRWIAEGAEYQVHWSFIPPQRPPLPAVKNEKWIRNPIDRFVLAQLEQRGLQPAPEADRRALARRLSLDLIGLPPDPQEVEAFVNDKAPNYYEKYVQKLLQSPHWGEHRGRYWLDAARYADTHGIHFDNYREVWSYRDWVINALNRNMKFDQFTIEQLAGDLLPNRTLDQQIASGFNRCNITTNEGGAIADEYLVLYTRDRVETTAQVWMGLTAGCGVCHNHKFDPLSQKEFYELAAFFNNTTQNAMDGNIKDTPPILLVPKMEDRPRWEKLAKQIEETRKHTDARKAAARADFDKWLAAAKPDTITKLIPTEGLTCVAPLSEGTGKSLNFTIAGKPRAVNLSGNLAWEAGHVAAKAYKSTPGQVVEVPDLGDFDAGQPFSYGAWVRLPRGSMTGAIFGRMNEAEEHRGWDLWLQGNLPGMHFINTWPSDALKVVAQTPLKPREWNHIFVTYDGSKKVSGVKIYVNGAPQPTTVEADSLKSTTRTKSPFKLAQRHTSARLDNLGLQDLRIYGRALTGVEVANLSRSTSATNVINKPAEKRTPKEKDDLFTWWLNGFDDVYKNLSKQVADLQAEEAGIRSRGTVAHVMQEKQEPATAFVLYRGEYDKRRDKVTPGTPKILPPFPANQPKNRLGFAHWILQSDQPLTARVTVNRFWQELFGTGIVRTSGDFGTTGEPPTHPELLDWLAVEFRAGGWDIQKFFTLLVTSATYRQAATATPEKLEKDPFNRLLSRGPRFRMDAEMVRDYALAASGLLVRKLGGPSVRPYQPEGVWEAVAMIGSNTRDYRRDTGANLYRRSMYTFWKRAAPPAQMEILNAPNRETCAVRRERTNTPLQALLTLNDVQFVEAARVLAQDALKAGKPDAALDLMARRLLARPFTPEELAVIRESLGTLLAHYKAKPDEAKKLIAVGDAKADPALDPATLAAWTMLANELFNLDEVLNK